MMLRKLLFALSAVLLVGATAACGDDNGDDNGNGNGDTDVDCTDPANADHEDCKTPPVTETPYCEEAENKDKPECQTTFAREGKVHSYVNALAIPESNEECCWDYVAGNSTSGNYDNAILELLPLVGMIDSTLDLDEVLNELFQDDSLTLIFEHDGFPTKQDDDNLNAGAFNMSLFIGETDEGVSVEDRMAGKGSFSLVGDALATIDTAFVRRNVVNADTNKLNLALPLADLIGEDNDLGLPDELVLPLSAVRLRFNVSEQTDGETVLGIKTSEEEGKLVTSVQGNPVNFLSGVIEGAPLASLLNDILGGMCGITGDLMTFDGETEGERPNSPTVSVNQELFDEMAAQEDETCKLIGGFGDVLGGIVPILFDVDVSGNGIYNGVSLGLNIGFTGATVE